MISFSVRGRFGFRKTESVLRLLPDSVSIATELCALLQPFSYGIVTDG